MMNLEKKVDMKYNIRTFFRRNKLLRVLIYPIKHIMDEKETNRYVKSYSSKQLKQLKNKYIGQKCCIVGNGPSLDVKDLEKLNCISFGSNYIFKIFDKTSWRPTFYCCFDDAVYKKIYSIIPTLDVNFKLIDYKQINSLLNHNDVIFINRKNRYTINPYSPDMARVSKDPSVFLGCCYTVTAECIQLAIYMGFKEIFLIGVDHSFSTFYDLKGKLNYISNNGNHFYSEGKVKAANAGCPYIVERGYELCKKIADEQNVKIINLSRTTKLNVFEKYNFDDFFH